MNYMEENFGGKRVEVWTGDREDEVDSWNWGL